VAVAVAAFARRHQRAGRLGLCHGRAAAALERAEAEAEAGAGSQSTVAAAAAAAAGPGARAPSSSSATASPLHAPPHPPHPAGSSSRGIGRAAAAAAAAAALTVAEVRGRTQAPTIRALRAAFRPCRRRRGTVIDLGGTAGATAGGEGRRRQEGGGEWAGVDGSEAGGESSWAAATSTLDGCAMQYGISAQDLAEFALYLGVDVAEEAELLPTVAQCAAAELPSGWHERLDPGGSGESYYWRIQHQQLELGGGTGHEVQWEHPLDEGFRSAISLQRAARSGQADHHSATSLNQLWQTLTSSPAPPPPSSPSSPLCWPPLRQTVNHRGREPRRPPPPPPPPLAPPWLAPPWLAPCTTRSTERVWRAGWHCSQPPPPPPPLLPLPAPQAL
jgi:hypothetical protein